MIRMFQSWNKAPPVFEVAATQLQAASQLCQVWAITTDYRLITSQRDGSEMPWGPWSTPDGAPAQVSRVAACQQGNGLAQVFLLDVDGQLWSSWQYADGTWCAFSGPNFGGAPNMQRICASAQGGGRGAQLFGITDANGIVTCYQATPGTDSWSDWVDFGGPNPCFEITASLQNDPRVQLFALDEYQSIWTNFQTAPGNGWYGFEGPKFNGQPGAFPAIATVSQGGSRGAQVWGVDGSGALWTCFEQVSGNEWTGWGQFPPFDTSTSFARIAAAQMADGNVMFWGIDENGSLWVIQQTSPGGGWGPWVNS